jgi:F-type H+-transporting ATPase subunit epsilon
MRLVVTTPTKVVEDVERVRHIRAEDATGAFGILPGHADFVTVLPVSVVTWRNREDREGFVLVRGGVLSVRGGDRVEIAARGAYREEELAGLSEAALAELRQSEEVEELTRTADTRMHLAMMRQIERVLRAGREGSAQPVLGRRSEGEAGESGSATP